MNRVARASVLIVCIVLSSACAEPPSKEMNQAQGAIEAARAAGAEQYAAQEFRGAVESLQQSEQAVTQKDYRLALNLAIESRERAQNAAKAAVDARSKARGDAERVVAEVTIRLSQARERLADPAMARLPRRMTDESTQTLHAVEERMQEARAALARDEYARAIELATATSAQLQRAEATIAKIARGDGRPPVKK
jgi:hypothetical protein